MERKREARDIVFLQKQSDEDDKTTRDDKCSYCLAFQCAPVLAGIKVSNLLIIKEALCNRAKKEISEAGTNYCLLYSSKERYIYLIYREKELISILGRSDVVSYLQEIGYDSVTSSDIVIGRVLDRLRHRFHESFRGKRDFPHEIGIFMGYPMEDVLSFVENEGHNFKISGYWKVYHRQEVALRVFKQYDLARYTAVKHIRSGGALSQLKDMFVRAYQESLLKSDIDYCTVRI